MASVTRRRTRNTDVPKTSKYVEPEDEELDDAEEEEERPARGRGRSRGTSRPAGRKQKEESRRPAGRGRGASSKPKAEGGWKNLSKAKSGDFSENLKVGDDEIIVKFLEEEPYAIFKQHWIKEADGRKSFTCLEELDGDCPLCDQLGDKPRGQILFNVVDLSDPNKPEVKTWAVGIRLAEKIEALSKKTRTSPINRDDLYWAVSKSGTGTRTEYSLDPVKANELEDWEVEPLDDDELDDFMAKCATEDSIRYDSRADLEELADDLS